MFDWLCRFNENIYQFPYLSNKADSRWDIELARCVLGDIEATAAGVTDAVGLEWPADMERLQAAAAAVGNAVRAGFEDNPPAVGAVLDAAGWAWTA